jgi:hypothetical protein
MNDGGVHTAFVHQDDGLLGGKGRHLSVREVARQAASPEVDLGVDDLHRFPSVYFCKCALPCPAVAVTGATQGPDTTADIGGAAQRRER